MSTTKLVLPNTTHIQLTNQTNHTNMSAVPYDEYADFAEKADFVANEVLLPIAVLVGIVGNILILIVLPRRSMRSSNTCFLIGIAVADLMVLVIQVPSLFKRITAVAENPNFALFHRYYSIPRYVLTNTFLTCTGWLTVAVTAERFIVIRFPLSARRISTIPRAVAAVILVFVISIALYISYYFEFVPITDLSSKKELNLTSLSQDPTYHQYQQYMDMVVASFLPCIILLIFNSLLVYKLAQHRSLRRRLSVQYSDRNNRHSVPRDDTWHVTLVVVSIVVVFLTSRAIATYLDILVALNGRDEAFRSGLMKGLKHISNFLVLTNSSVNFILYCLIGTRFRKTFLRVFGFCCCGHCDAHRLGYMRAATDTAMPSNCTTRV